MRCRQSILGSGVSVDKDFTFVLCLAELEAETKGLAMLLACFSLHLLLLCLVMAGGSDLPSLSQSLSLSQ